MNSDTSYDLLGPPPPQPTLTRTYNTKQVPIRNENAVKIQAKVRSHQAKEKVKKIKKKIDNLALATLQQGVKSFKNIPVQLNFKKMLGLGGSRRQRTHKRRQNKRKTLHKKKTQKRNTQKIKTQKRKTYKRRRH